MLKLTLTKVNECCTSIVQVNYCSQLISNLPIILVTSVGVHSFTSNTISDIHFCFFQVTHCF